MSEDDLKRRCVAWLNKSRLDIWFYCPTDRFYSGIPDVIFCARGFFGWAELKAPKGRVSRIQEWMHSELRISGARGAVCRSLVEFRDFVMLFYK